MRILMVTQFYSPTIGGQERVVEDLSAELIARGHHVAVATLQQGGLPGISEVAGVPVYRIGSTAARLFRGYSDPERPHSPPAVDPRAAAELRRVIDVEKPDIVHGHDWLIHSFLPSKRRDGPGLVVTLHDHSLVCANKRLIRQGEACAGPGPAKCLRCAAAHYGLAKGPAIAVGNWVMSTAERALVDMFLPVSQVVADAAGLRDGSDAYRVIPNFLPEVPTAAAAEQKVPGLPRKFVLFVGDVSRDKGIGVLLEAHGLLEDAPPLILLGRIVDPEILAPVVGAERVSRPELLAAAIGNVRAVGAQPHEVVLDAFRRCTVAVVPSLMHEAFGLVALEAMKVGRPVIASDIGGLREIISDGKNGILVAPGDVEALHTALARVLTDTKLRARLRTAAKRRADDFAADRIVPQVEQAYEDVLAGRRSRAVRRRPFSLPAARLADGLPRVGRLLRQIGPGAGVLGGRIWQGLHRREPRVVLAFTALAIAGLAIPAGTWARVILVSPLVLFLPGYALSGVIFRDGTPGWLERISLALGLSLVATALAGLLLYLAGADLTLNSWTAALAVISGGAAVAAAARPSAVPEGSTPVGARIEIRLPPRLPIAIVVAAAGLVAAAVVLARTPLPSPAARGYTALWLTREHGSAALILGVRSEEHSRTRYVLRLTLRGRTTKRRFSLAPGETWRRRLPPADRAVASLYRADRPGVYRSVRLRTGPSR